MPINLQGSSVKLMCGDHAIAKMYCQGHAIYSSGNTVTYHVDVGVSYQEEVDEGASCLSPASFTPSRDGWEFTGWRQDTEANGEVLSALLMGDAPITLYAVFTQTVTLAYNGNSATSGSMASQNGTRYYNNGNVENPGFVLSANGFSRTSYTFSKWALDSAGGTQYAAGASITLAANATMYAVWKLIPVPSVITDLESAWTCTWTKLSGDNCGGVSVKAASVTCYKIDTSTGANCTLKSSIIPTNGCTKLVIGNINIFTSGTITVYGQNGANLGSLTSSDSGKTFDVSGYSGIYFYCVAESRPWAGELGWQPYGGVYLKA